MPFQIGGKLGESSESLPGHLQWTLSKDVFQKVLSGATWLSKSTAQHAINTEHQPLLKGRKRNYSYNEIYQAQNINARRALWPSVSNLPFTISAHEPVTISEVCRTVTPIIPPIPEDHEGVNWVTAAFLLVNAALGIGILNFPAAYDLAGGIVSATCTQLVMLVLIVLTMLILAHCSDVNLDVTYHDVLLSMCGRKAQKLAAVSICCTCYGVCVAIFIIIGDQLDRLFLAAVGSTFCHHWYLERHFTIPAASIFLILPICYFKRVDFLRYAGSLGIFAMLYPVFLTVYGYFKLDIKDVHVKTAPDSIPKFFVVIPVLCLAYQCQEVVVPVYACMRERTLKNLTKSCCLSMVFLFLIYSVIGCFGYLTFGSLVSPNVMKMYDASDPVVMVGIGALIIKMVVTYPVLALCGRGAVDGLYSELRKLSAAEFMIGEKRRRIIIASLWFSSSLLIALYTKSIGTVIHALGSVSSANIFIYPGICLIQVTLQTDRDLKRKKSYLLIAAGILLAAVGAFFCGIILVDCFMNGSGSEADEVLCL
ncbi:sodium-coupled neutral amino acid transporter 7 isoform X2 [Parasteatoda tepidariorum]|uniref:sodium-coupled neutral amino acid transporter 7 isoform X2 n=1 Tax=Parasteatoda tepidariorum TaxID=114398 RepID=UPI001C7194DB|nr:putative sodium-coupled neutral amino acid transporter 7 isoform X2 [Parasteatoda tepidariorum]